MAGGSDSTPLMTTGQLQQGLLGTCYMSKFFIKNFRLVKGPVSYDYED